MCFLWALWCCFASTSASFAQKNNITGSLRDGVEHFIDSVEIENGGRLNYNIFYVLLRQKRKSKCLDVYISYFMNYSDFEVVKPSCYMKVGRHFVVVNRKSVLTNSNFTVNLYPIDSAVEDSISRKLFQKSEGVITSNPQGAYMRFCGKKSKWAYFEYAVDMFETNNASLILEKPHVIRVQDVGK